MWIKWINMGKGCRTVPGTQLELCQQKLGWEVGVLFIRKRQWSQWSQQVWASKRWFLWQRRGPIFMGQNLEAELFSHELMSNSFTTPVCSPPGSPVHGISQARILELGCHFLLQGIFPTQGSNPYLPHWQTDRHITLVQPLISVTCLSGPRAMVLKAWSLHLERQHHLGTG